MQYICTQLHSTHTHMYMLCECIHYTIISCRELSEERELLNDSVGENRHLSRKLGRMERTLDRIDHEKNSVRFVKHTVHLLSNSCFYTNYSFTRYRSCFSFSNTAQHFIINCSVSIQCYLYLFIL